MPILEASSHPKSSDIYDNVSWYASPKRVASLDQPIYWNVSFFPKHSKTSWWVPWCHGAIMLSISPTISCRLQQHNTHQQQHKIRRLKNKQSLKTTVTVLKKTHPKTPRHVFFPPSETSGPHQALRPTTMWGGPWIWVTWRAQTGFKRRLLVS